MDILIKLNSKEFGRTRKEAVMTKFEVLSWHWLKRHGKPKNNLSHDNHSVGQDLNAEQSKYEAGAQSDSV